MWSWIKEFLFLWISNGYSLIFVNSYGIRDPLKQNLAIQLCRNRNKDVNILTGTHINLNQIRHIRNNWLGAIFFSPGDSHTKGFLSCFVWVLKVSLRLKLIQKRGLCPLRLLTLMAEFSVFIPLQGITPGNSCLGGVFLKDYKIIWKIKIREIKTNNTWRL